VAQTLARRWSAAGHQITFGSRDPSSKQGPGFPVAPLATTVGDHEIVVNATPGSASLELAEGIGAAAFAGKVLVDVANANTPSFELSTRTPAWRRSYKQRFPKPTSSRP
jgi:predicted dinucleotide-binding enzyme